jgi:hypothetical protein
MRKLDLNLRRKLVKCLYGTETLELREVDSKYLENCGMWFWRRSDGLIV